MSQRDLAKVAGVSVGGMDYMLSALVDKSILKLGNFIASQEKRLNACVLTPKGIARKAELTRALLARKME